MGVNNKQNMDKQELSGVMVIIIIGGGVLMSIILFIFAKRQIMRFTIRSRRGPHLPVGHDSKKVNIVIFAKIYIFFMHLSSPVN